MNIVHVTDALAMFSKTKDSNKVQRQNQMQWRAGLTNPPQIYDHELSPWGTMHWWRPSLIAHQCHPIWSGYIFLYADGGWHSLILNSSWPSPPLYLANVQPIPLRHSYRLHLYSIMCNCDNRRWVLLIYHEYTHNSALALLLGINFQSLREQSTMLQVLSGTWRHIYSDHLQLLVLTLWTSNSFRMRHLLNELRRYTGFRRRKG